VWESVVVNLGYRPNSTKGKNFYRLPFTPPSLVTRIGPSVNTEDPWIDYLIISRLAGCYATPIIHIFQDGRFRIKIDPQLESATQPKARGLLHMECDFATALPYNVDFKTDELHHLPASWQFKYC
jgi:hypothetical protein